MTGRLRGRPDGDAGASLIIALAFMTFIGLVVGALLSYSGTSLRGTKATKAAMTQDYDVDSALQTAINQIRNSAYNNETGQTCTALSFPRAGGTAVTVNCAGTSGTGGTTAGVPITSANRPGQAVLTLGTNAGELGIAQSGTNILRIQGKVFSKGGINTGNATLKDVNAQVVAQGTCVGTVISSDAQGNVISNNCSAPANLIPADPAYAQPTSGLVYRPLPSCANTGSTVEFSPGYYDDAVGLSAMMGGTGTCSGKTFLFQAAAGGGLGVYYFDFHNGEGGGLPAGGHTWTIADQNAFVVGGTPRGWVPDVSAPVIPTTFPGSCASPLTTTTSNGVEFVFGGDSRLYLGAGSVELCGQYSATIPPVAVYGAKTGADVLTGPVTAKTDGTGSNPGTGPAFATPANITENDTVTSNANVNVPASNPDVTASVLVKGFVPAPAVPAGSILTGAVLNVVHRENNATNKTMKSLGITVTPNESRAGATALTGIAQPTMDMVGPNSTTNHTDAINLLASAQLANEVHTYGLAGMQVRYDATVAAGNNVTEKIDSIQLVLSWKPPAVRGQQTTVNGTASCVVAYPGGCPFLQTSLNNTALYVQGTTYAPYAALDINLTNSTAQVFRSGLIARALSIQLTASASFSGALIEVPDDSSVTVPLEVYLRAYVSGRLVGTAQVRYSSADPTVPPTPGHRNVNVISWTVQRS
jgi:Tfp pilus assembly protein PilX